MSRKSKNKKKNTKAAEHEQAEEMPETVEAIEEISETMELADSDVDIEGSELESFDSAEIEDIEELSEEHMCSVVESLLFSTDKPMSVKAMKSAFQGTQIKVADIRTALNRLSEEYEAHNRGVIIEEVAGGFQLRTKPSNMKFLKQTMKARPFKLSGPALEVLSIVAYKQPCIKMAVDEIRGVESGHLMRGLLDRGLLRFGGKSELPGRPMLYETTRKFLEIFGLRNLNELPSLNEIDQILPEGIDEDTEKKETLSDLTGRLGEEFDGTYSQAEEELGKITDELQAINTSTEFFEKEKQRQKDKRDAERAQEIREQLIVGEEVSTRDKNWLERYELAQAEQQAEPKETVEATADVTQSNEMQTDEMQSDETLADEMPTVEVATAETADDIVTDGLEGLSFDEGDFPETDDEQNL